MSEDMFRYYNPPMSNEVFSNSGKDAIAQIKLRHIAERITETLLEGDTLQTLMDGFGEHVVEYDREGLRKFITFGSPDDEFNAFGLLVKVGFSRALAATQSQFPGQLGMALMGCEDEPGTSAIVMKCFNE
jgi:hypothetical protein